MDSCSPSMEVIKRVAQRENTDATELPPLYESLDPTALDNLLQAEATITFEYAGYHLTVEGGDRVTVTIGSGLSAGSTVESTGRSAGTTD